jgi:hypothetical protein
LGEKGAGLTPRGVLGVLGVPGKQKGRRRLAPAVAEVFRNERRVKFEDT